MVTLASLKVEEAINDFKEGLIVFAFARSKNQWTETTNGQSTTVFSTDSLTQCESTASASTGNRVSVPTCTDQCHEVLG